MPLLPPESRSIIAALEADLILGKPGELDCGRGYGLLRGRIRRRSGGVDRRQPALVGEVTIHFEILANALDDPKVDVVERGSAGDEVLGGLLAAEASLNPLVAAQVIDEPGLAAFAFAAHPVAE